MCSDPFSNHIRFRHEIEDRFADFVKPSVIFSPKLNLIDRGVCAEISLNSSMSASKIRFGEGERSEICLPSLVTLFRIARLATRKQISNSVTMPTEPAVFHSGKYVVPSLRIVAAVRTFQITFRIVPKRSHRRTNSIDLVWIVCSD